MPVYKADGKDILAVYANTKAAIAYARQHRAPVALVLGELPRRFGHAATDRQAAYMSKEEIEAVSANNPLAGACALAVAAGVCTPEELATQFESLWQLTRMAFNAAVMEPKITRRAQINVRTSVPLVPVPASAKIPTQAVTLPVITDPGRDVMRKHMTNVFDELLKSRKNMVYIGEDVEHGGYYLVTDGLAAKHPHRVRDFPPDETSLIGAGIGFAQSGLLPIVEIPYAKYLDCGADMFFEAALSCWLSCGQQPNGTSPLV